MLRLLDLFALNQMDKFSGEFLLDGFLNADQARLIRNRVCSDYIINTVIIIVFAMIKIPNTTTAI